MFSAKVIADSRGELSRLTTIEITYPRIVHSEMLRHRVYSRNTASSRAIPIKRVIEQVRTNPFIPIYWGAAQSGMQAYTELTGWRKRGCRFVWLQLRWVAIFAAWLMLKMGLHKQIPNRVLEPWVWVTEIVSGTNWSNFFHLRCHEAAEPHCRKIAELIQEALANSTPVNLQIGEWHIPYGDVPEGTSTEDRLRIATARISRASYVKQDTIKSLQDDLNQHDTLAASGHWSPFEHCARKSWSSHLGGNFGPGWFQYRKSFANECR
jgi:hypothetical protein